MEKTNAFEQIKPEESRKLLQGAILGKDKLKIWTTNQTHSIQTRVSSTLDSAMNFFITIPAENNELEFISQIKSAHIDELFFTLTLPTDVLFFKGELKKTDKLGFNFKVIEPVFKVQRRTAYRLPIPEMQKLFCEFDLSEGDEAHFKLRIFDLSAGGLGLFVSDSIAATLLNPETKIKNLKFKIRNIEFNLLGEIRYRKEIPLSKVSKAYRVGLKFLNLSPSQDSFLTGFVFEESLKFSGRN